MEADGYLETLTPRTLVSVPCDVQTSLSFFNELLQLQRTFAQEANPWSSRSITGKNRRLKRCGSLIDIRQTGPRGPIPSVYRGCLGSCSMGHYQRHITAQH